MALFLTILAIIGKVLLIVIGIIVLLVLLILIVPASYKVNINTDTGLKAAAKFKILFGFVSAGADLIDGKLSWDVKVLFFSLKNIITGKGKKDKKKEEKHDELEEYKKRPPTIMPGEKAGKAEINEAKKNVKAEEERKKKKLPDEPHFVDEDPKPSLIEKIKLTLSSIYDKIQKGKEALGVYKSIKKNLWKIIKQVLPKKLKGRIAFGFEDPSTTGKILAAAGAL